MLSRFPTSSKKRAEVGYPAANASFLTLFACTSDSECRKTTSALLNPTRVAFRWCNDLLEKSKHEPISVGYLPGDRDHQLDSLRSNHQPVLPQVLQPAAEQGLVWICTALP